MRPPRPGSPVDIAAKGVLGATLGQAAGAALGTVGATGIGGAITGVSVAATGAVSGIPIVGGIAAPVLTSVGATSAAVGAGIGAAAVIAAPLVIAGAVGLGIGALIAGRGRRDDIHIHNDTRRAIWVAIHYCTDVWHTKAWFKFGPREEACILSEMLTSRNIYVHAFKRTAPDEYWGEGHYHELIDRVSRPFTKYDTGTTRGKFAIRLYG